MVQFTQHTQFNLGDEVNNITQAHQLSLHFVAKYERKEAITILLLYKSIHKRFYVNPIIYERCKISYKIIHIIEFD